jgi:hypothetical protein
MVAYMAHLPKILSSEIKTLEFSGAVHDELPMVHKMIENK